MTKGGISVPRNNVNQRVLAKQLADRFIPAGVKLDVRPFLNIDTEGLRMTGPVINAIDAGLYAGDFGLRVGDFPTIGKTAFPGLADQIDTGRVAPRFSAALSGEASYDIPPLARVRGMRFWSEYKNSDPKILREPVWDVVEARDEGVGVSEAFGLMARYLEEGRVCLVGDVHNSPAHSSLFLDAVEAMADTGRDFAVGLELPASYGSAWNFASLDEMDHFLPLVGFRQPEVAIPFQRKLIEICRDRNLPIVVLDNPELGKSPSRRSPVLPQGWDRDDWMSQRSIDFQEIDAYIQRYSMVPSERRPGMPILAFLGGDHIKSTGIPSRLPDAVSFMLTLRGPRFAFLESLARAVTRQQKPYFNYLINT